MFVAAAVLTPMMYPDVLKVAKASIPLSVPLAPPPPPPPAGNPAPKTAPTKPTEPPKVFVPPTKVPTEVAKNLPEDPNPPQFEPRVGVPGGDPRGKEGGVPNGVPESIGDPRNVIPLPPPPPPPAEVKKANPAPTGPVRVGGDVQAAKILSQPKPAYPALARSIRQQGTVRLSAVISRDGQVVNLTLVSGPPLLVAAAMDAVRQWRYRPTLLNGEAVEVLTQIDVNFTLNAQ